MSYSQKENQDNYEIDEDAAEPDGNDIRDIDFKLMHDVSDLKVNIFFFFFLLISH